MLGSICVEYPERQQGLEGISELLKAQTNPWRTLASRIAYENPFYTVREDSVVRPDGSEGTYSVVELPQSVGVLAIDKDDRVAAVIQWRYVHDAPSLEIPTGSFEEGESIEDAARRELKEETGLTGGHVQIFGVIQNSNGATTDIAHLARIRDLMSGAKVNDQFEATELVWIPFVVLFEAVMNGLVTESTTVAAILWEASTRLGGLSSLTIRHDLQENATIDE